MPQEVTHALAQRSDIEALRRGEKLDRQGLTRVVWSRSLPAEAPDPARTHVSGHTPLSRVRRDLTRRLIRLDRGVYAGTRLAAWCPRLDRVVTVPSDVCWRRGQL